MISFHKDTPYASSSGNFWKPKTELPTPKKIMALLGATEPTEEDEITLSEVLNISLSNNPDTQVSWAKAKAAAFAYDISLADYYPEIDITVDASQQYQSHGYFSDAGALLNTSTAYGDTVDKSWGPSGTVSYVLWDFGKRSSNASAYLNALFSQNYAHNETVQTIIKSSMNAYYDFLYQKALLESLRSDLDDLQTSFVAAEEKLKFGVTDVTDMLQAKTAYLAKKLAYDQQIAKKETSFISLLNTMGLPGSVRFQVGSFPDNPNLSNLSESVDTLAKLALEVRPDVIAQRATLLQREAELKKAKAELWPTVQASASGGERWFSGIGGAQPNYSLQLSLTYPLFAGFKYVNQVKRANAKLEQSQYQLRMKELSVTQEVQAYYTDFEQARIQVTTATEFLSSAQEEFTAILSNYERGTRTILDVLSAVSSLANARSQVVEAKNALFSSLSNVAYATGMLTLDSEDYETTTP